MVEGHEDFPDGLIQEDDGQDGQGPDDQGVLGHVEVDVLVGSHSRLVTGYKRNFTCIFTTVENAISFLYTFEDGVPA